MLLRALITAAVVLGVVVPAIALALWQNRGNGARRFASVGVVAVLIVLDEVVLRAPRLGIFTRLEWNWQGKILEVGLSILAILALSMTAEEAAVSRPRANWVWPVLVAGTAILLLPMTFFLAAHARETLTWEGWAFQLTMPGLAEELLSRGVIQGLLNRGLGKHWKILGAQIGWGWLIASMLFAAAHMVSVNRQRHIELALDAAIGPLIGSVIGGWLRERIASIWPVAVVHNLSNLLMPALTFLFK